MIQNIGRDTTTNKNDGTVKNDETEKINNFNEDESKNEGSAVDSVKSAKITDGIISCSQTTALSYNKIIQFACVDEVEAKTT